MDGGRTDKLIGQATDELVDHLVFIHSRIFGSWMNISNSLSEYILLIGCEAKLAKHILSYKPWSVYIHSLN